MYCWAVSLAAFKWIYEASSAQRWPKGVHASLRRLQMLKWDQWRAYAMLIKIKSLPTDIDARIDVLDRVCFALTVSTPDQRRVSEMMGAPRRCSRKGTFGKQAGVHIHSQAQNDRLIRHLSAPITDNQRRATIMRWIEAAAHGDRVPRYLIDPRSSVEHVYPRNPETNWSAFEAGLEFNQLATLREMTGNLCILPQDELGNGPFEEKRRFYTKMRARFATEIARTKYWSLRPSQARTRKLTDFTLRFLDLDVWEPAPDDRLR